MNYERVPGKLNENDKLNLISDGKVIHSYIIDQGLAMALRDKLSSLKFEFAYFDETGTPVKPAEDTESGKEENLPDKGK